MIRRIGKYSIWTSAVILAFIVVVGSVFVWRISQGPVSLRFLNPWITAALAGQNTDIIIEFEETILVWASDRNSLEVRLVNISFSDINGMPLSSFPEASIEFSGSALLRGMLAPARLEVFGPTLPLGRLADNTISFGGTPIGAEGAEPNQGAVLVLLGELLSQPDKDSVTGYLEEITISGADLSFMDWPSNTFWHVPDAQLSLLRAEDGINASLFGEVEVKGQRWTVAASGQYDISSEVIRVTIEVADIEPYVLANENDGLAALAAIHFPISGSLEAKLTKDGDIISVSVDLVGGSGYIDLPDLYPNGFDISAVELNALYRPEDQTIIIRSGSVAIEETVVDVSGYVAFHDAGVETNVAGTFSQLPAAELARHWPVGIAAKTRTWLRDNITAGTITDGKYWVRVQPGRERGALTSEEIEVDFNFENLTGHYTRPMPPLTAATGHAIYAGDYLDLYLDAAEVGGLQLSEGHLLVEQITQPLTIATVDVVVTGSLKDTLLLIDSEPINSLKRAGFTPEGVRGNAATRTHLEFPLRAGIKAEEIMYAAAATITDAYLPRITDKIWLDHGNMLVQANSSGLIAEGSAEINGVPTQANWQLNFQDVDGIRATYKLTGEMNVESLKTLDIDITDYIAGDVSFDATISQRIDGTLLVGVDGDITGAEAKVPLPGWVKPVDDPGSIHVDVIWNEGEELRIENLEVSAENFEVQGEIKFDADAVLRQAKFSYLRFGSSELESEILNTGNNTFHVSLTGASYDAALLLEDLFASDEGIETASLATYEAEIEVAIASVLIGKGVEIRDVGGSGRIVNGFWTDTRFDGKLNGSALFAVAIDTVGPNERLLRIETHDASALFRGMGYFDGGEGGILNFTMTMHEAGEQSRNEGRLIVDDFVVHDMPALGRILSLGSLTGFSEVMAGEGISFERLYAPFAYDKATFRVTEARAFGPALGFTMSGGLDRVRKTMKFDGTIVPAYSINSVLGNLPIVGRLLVGEEGSGVFAITYGVAGPYSDPVFTVNPLSAVTPGFLRGITSILDPSYNAPAEERVELQDAQSLDGEAQQQ